MVLCEKGALMRIQGSKHLVTCVAGQAEPGKMSCSPCGTSLQIKKISICFSASRFYFELLCFPITLIPLYCLSNYLSHLCLQPQVFTANTSDYRLPASLKPPLLWNSSSNTSAAVFHPCAWHLETRPLVLCVCLFFMIDEWPNKCAHSQSHIPSQEWCFILFAGAVMCIKSISAHSATAVMGFFK